MLLAQQQKHRTQIPSKKIKYNIIKGNNCNEAHIEVRTIETASVAQSLQNRRYTQLHIPNFKSLGLVRPTLDKG